MKKKHDLKPFGAYLEQLSYAHDRYSVFDDFLTIIVCTLSMGRQEELYFKTIRGYKKEEIDLFCQAYSSLILQMDNNRLEDALGGYFEEFLSHGHNGQFFTPQCVCDLMSAITHAPKAGTDTGEEKDKRVYDPACGSGRLLLSSAKLNRERYFIGADISCTCCLMTLVNMCLNSLNGEVLHMNSLTGKIWRRWLVIVDLFTNIPSIYEVIEKENNPVTAVPEIKTEAIEIKEDMKHLELLGINDIGFVRFSAKV